MPASTSSSNKPSIPDSEEEEEDQKVAAPTAAAPAAPATATAAPEEPPPPLAAAAAAKTEDPRETAYLRKHARREDTCPLSQELLTDPVIASDGITYQRAALEAYKARAEAAGETLKSPVTGEVIVPVFFPNVAVKRLVEQYADAKRAEWRQLLQAQEERQQQQLQQKQQKQQKEQQHKQPQQQPKQRRRR
jgi:hypothetical protein